MLVNAHPSDAIPTTIRLTDWPTPERVTGRRISGASYMSLNSWQAPDEVTLRPLSDDAVTLGERELTCTLPPHSVTEWVLAR